MRFKSEEAKRAIYIDFEGMEKVNGQQQQPWLLGTLQGPKYHFYLMDPKMEILGCDTSSQLARHIPKSLQMDLQHYTFSCEFVPDFATVMRQLQERYTQDNCKLYAYSNAEERIIQSFADSSIRDDLLANLVNAKLQIQKWWNRGVHEYDWAPIHDKTLKNYLKAAGYKHEVQEPAKVRSKLLPAINGVSRWDEIRKDTKTLWLKFLTYNFKDCHGLEFLTRKATQFHA